MRLSSSTHVIGGPALRSRFLVRDHGLITVVLHPWRPKRPLLRYDYQRRFSQESSWLSQISKPESIAAPLGTYTLSFPQRLSTINVARYADKANAGVPRNEASIVVSQILCPMMGPGLNRLGPHPERKTQCFSVHRLTGVSSSLASSSSASSIASSDSLPSSKSNSSSSLGA